MTKASQIESIHSAIRKCRRCQLGSIRKNAVPGEGPSDAEIVLLGEAPGAQEDETGRPFIGRSGQLLTRMLEEAGIPREDVFITSILKCRPPDNRTPRKNEVEACRPFLQKQINAINPRVVVLLGGVAISSILGPWKVTETHGTFFEGDDERIYFMTFHPAAALRFRKYADLMAGDLRKLKEWL